MKTAIVLPGRPSKEEFFDPMMDSLSNAHWFPWIQKQLLMNNILAQTPEMPKPYEPIYEDWLRIFRQFEVDESTLLVGHSCEAGFLLRWLSENMVKVGRVILVAPWLNPVGAEVRKKSIEDDFFRFTIDRDMFTKTDGITVFYSDDDFDGVLLTVERLENEIENITVRKFHGYEHFTYNDMGTREFPELLEECLK